MKQKRIAVFSAVVLCLAVLDGLLCSWLAHGGGALGPEELARRFERDKPEYSIVFGIGSLPEGTLCRYYRSVQGIKVVNDFYDVLERDGGEIQKIKKSRETAPRDWNEKKLMAAFDAEFDSVERLVNPEGISVAKVERVNSFLVSNRRMLPVLTLNIAYDLKEYTTLETYYVNLFNGKKIDPECFMRVEYQDGSSFDTAGW